MYDMNQRWKHKFEIKPGKWVHVPADGEIEYGTKLNKQLQKRFPFPNLYWHLKCGGHVKALNEHTESKYFASLDLGGFFTSITRNRVTRSLKGRYSYQQARDIATRSTVWTPDQNKYVLPFGFVQSTLLATICLNQSTLGSVLQAISNTPNLAVSVYVDDIIVSGLTIGSVLSAFDRLKLAVTRSNFNINNDKLQEVSESIEAFNIRLTHNELLITDKRMIQFQDAYASATSKYSQEGILTYISSVNPLQSNLMK